MEKIEVTKKGKEEREKCDDTFRRIGEFGKYQLLCMLLIGLTCSISSITGFSYIFIGGLPKFRLIFYLNDKESFKKALMLN